MKHWRDQVEVMLWCLKKLFELHYVNLICTGAYSILQFATPHTLKKVLVEFKILVTICTNAIFYNIE